MSTRLCPGFECWSSQVSRRARAVPGPRHVLFRGEAALPLLEAQAACPGRSAVPYGLTLLAQASAQNCFKNRDSHDFLKQFSTLGLQY